MTHQRQELARKEIAGEKNISVKYGVGRIKAVCIYGGISMLSDCFY